MVAGDGGAGAARHGEGAPDGGGGGVAAGAVLVIGGGCENQGEDAGAGRGPAAARGSGKSQGASGERGVCAAADGAAQEGRQGAQVRVRLYGRQRMQGAAGEGREVVPRAREDDELQAGKAGAGTDGRRERGDGEPASGDAEPAERKDHGKDGRADAMECGHCSAVREAGEEIWPRINANEHEWENLPQRHRGTEGRQRLTTDSH